MGEPESSRSSACRFDAERAFFDSNALEKEVLPTSRAVLERYRQSCHAELYGKEYMFKLLGDPVGKQVLVVGCGEGQDSVQLAYCGAHVHGFDISGQAVEAARRRAELDGVEANFWIANLEIDELPESAYDVVWCNMILHHVVPALDDVLPKLRRALKPQGTFIAREPLAYAGWLKRLRLLSGFRLDATPDEQPLRHCEMSKIAAAFPGLRARYFRLLARVDMLGVPAWGVRLAARCDNVLLQLPVLRRLTGDVVVWSTTLGPS